MAYYRGGCWSRPGLDHETRSMLDLIMPIALDRRDEFELHLGGALRNGVTEEEIQEGARRDERPVSHSSKVDLP